MGLIDWMIAAGALALILCIGMWFAKRAGSSSDEFILSGRNLPWWLAGTSMSAANFSADSPLHNSRRARVDGLNGLWLYWSYIVGQVMSAIFLVRLSRRSGIRTPVELYQMRYGGRAGHYSRVYQSVFFCVFQCTMSMATALLAMLKLVHVLLDLPDRVLGMPTDIVLIIGIIICAVSYSAASGLWGVVATDFLEFFIAILTSFILTFIVFAKVGWASGLREGLAEVSVKTGIDYLTLRPEVTLAFIVWFFISPLILAGLNSTTMHYLAVKDERESVLTALWQQFNSFVIRGWPWWIAGLASLVLIGDGVLSDPEQVYPQMIRDYMPVGLKGLMITGLVCAFLSTIDTRLHNFSAIFLNDIYRPYIRKNSSEKHYVRVLRISVIFGALVGAVIALCFDDILKMLLFVFKVHAMIGIATIVRWYWWRFNGWSDFVMQVCALPFALLLHFDKAISSALGFATSPTEWIVGLLRGHAGSSAMDSSWAVQYLMGMIIVLIIGIITVFVTPSDSKERLLAFYKKVRPYGFWGPIRKEAGVGPVDSFGQDVVKFILGLLFSYGGLFGVGILFFGLWGWAIAVFALSVLSFIMLLWMLRREYADGTKLALDGSLDYE